MHFLLMILFSVINGLFTATLAYIAWWCLHLAVPDLPGPSLIGAIGILLTVYIFRSDGIIRATFSERN